MSNMANEEQVFYNREHLEEMGCLNVKYSQLEQELSYQIGEVLELDADVCDIITSELSINGRIALLCSLVKHKFNDSRVAKAIDKDLEILCNHIEKAIRERNKMIHSAWYINSDARYLTRSKSTARKQGLKREEIRIYVKDIENARFKIEAVIEELINFGERWKRAIHY